MKRIGCVWLLFLLTTALFADLPIRKEQFIYSIVAYNGSQYSGTFCREGSDTVYFIADNENFIIGEKTFVYFWSLTKEWRTDSRTFQMPVEGTLEIRGNTIETRRLEKQDYTYYILKNDYGNELVLATGEEAREIKDYYRKQINDYYKAVSDYNRAKNEYDQKMMELAGLISKMRNEGKEVADLQQRLRAMEPPSEPAKPDEFVVPPSQVRAGYMINLPVGEYSMRLLNEDGKVIEHSDKRLIVFEKNRTKGVGYEIIPGDKWTRPEESKTPRSVVYVNGSTDLYLRPFFEDEYNDHYYKKMDDNNESGNPNIMTWVRNQQIPKATIEVFRGGSRRESATKRLSEAPYFVQQRPGSALGYTIVPYDPEGKHKDRNPSIIAHHLPLQPEDRSIKVRVLDMAGNALMGSERVIRIIHEDKPNIALIVLSCIPLVTMVVVISLRRRVYQE